MPTTRETDDMHRAERQSTVRTASMSDSIGYIATWYYTSACCEQFSLPEQPTDA
ncbi:hypothetical protein [Xylella fastidiosa]|uniref:hypothetical protein n=1 Tax=Xylella fastidiosa TaxID=2371 RepID=UPI000B268758|nr:hypothetical protein [Xylella fastidiosa]WNY18484.1 hypothetical protein RO839_08305 [Xylella fastidiosa]